MSLSLFAAFVLLIPTWLGAQGTGVAPWLPLDSGVSAFVGVNVIPMDRDTVLASQTVVVRNGRIESIGSSASARVPSGVRQVDGAGKWLIPGLADAHVHLVYLMNGKHNPLLLREFVAGGVTTIINLLGLPEHLELRTKVARGEILGPTIFTSGFYVGQPFTRNATHVDSVVNAQRAAGFDMVKLHGSIDADAYQALIAATKRDSIALVGHLPRNLGLTTALDGGQKMIAHAEEYLYGWFGFRTITSREQATALVDTAAMLTAKAGTWVTPSLRVFGAIPAQRQNLDSVLNTPEMKRLPDALKFDWKPDRNSYLNIPLPALESFRNQHLLLRRLTLALHKAGVPLLMGTDALATAAVPPGTSAHEELQELVAAGLTPYEALRTATTNVARFLGQPNEFGVIKAGSRADLLLLDANPLVDIGATKRIAGVMLRGRWLDAAALDSLRKG